MSENLYDIVLRPRFKRQLDHDNETILKRFEEKKNSQTDFVVNRIDDHVFIKFPKSKQQFWTPQLHLEINKNNENSSILYGLFGPNPTVWTMFMFLHFFVACVFIASSIWAYSNYVLKVSYELQVSLIIFTVILWLGLYFGGRIGKSSNKGAMHALNNFMEDTLRS